MNKKTYNPPTLFDSRQFGFSQITTATAGRMIFISGQVAWDEKMNIVGANNLAVQGQKAIDNLKIALEAVGAGLENVVMLRIYKVNYTSDDGTVIGQLLRDNFGTENPPASTWLNVEGLANEDFMIEIEAQAVI